MSTIIDKEKIPADDPLRAQLAHRLKRERETRGLTIAALAGLSGVSKAMISKVERAEASPTADLLGRLSGAFGLTVSTLLARAEADGSGGRISRTGDQAGWTDPETGFRRLALSPPGTEPEMVLATLPPGARIAYPASAYAFLQGQCVWVMSGSLTVEEGSGKTELASGDCLAFDLMTAKDCALINPSSSVPVTYVVALIRR